MKKTITAGLVVGTILGGLVLVNTPTIYDPIAILEKSKNVYEKLDNITKSLYTDFGPARRSTVIIYTTKAIPGPNLRQVHAHLVAETKASDRDSLFSTYSNLLINTGSNYYRDFLQGKCATITTEELGVVDDIKRELEVYAISCPIYAPYLVGEVSIAFDSEYKTTSSYQEVEDRLRREAIKISNLLEEKNE